jgi:NAD(P)-dependent dehydrogenase (short-subunit alcohol dehydrogenase family)
MYDLLMKRAVRTTCFDLITKPRESVHFSQTNRSNDGIPMRLPPLSSDYGRAAVFLASDDAAMITGTDLRIDAGAIGRYWAWAPKTGATL